MSKFSNAMRLVEYGRTLLATGSDKIVVDRDALAELVRIVRRSPRYTRDKQIARDMKDAQA